MANVMVRTAGGFEVTFDGVAEWDITSTSLNGNADLDGAPLGVSVQSVELIIAATDDIFTLRDGGVSGRRIMSAKIADAYDDRIKYFNHDAFGVKLFKLYVKAAEVTAGTIMLVEF